MLGLGIGFSDESFLLAGRADFLDQGGSAVSRGLVAEAGYQRNQGLAGHVDQVR